MSNVRMIQLRPKEFVRDIPIVWDLHFVNTGAFIGVLEEFEDGYMFTTSFKSQYIVDDHYDLDDLLENLFVPPNSSIN